jgi:hypothetical protein
MWYCRRALYFLNTKLVQWRNGHRTAGCDLLNGHCTAGCDLLNGHCTAGCDLRPFTKSMKYFASSTKLVRNYTLLRNKIVSKFCRMFVPQFKRYWLVCHCRGLDLIPDQFLSDIGGLSGTGTYFPTRNFPLSITIQHISNMYLSIIQGDGNCEH